ncbi:class I SAM-dependent methyltransferase [Aegicerativicinus sediminis]|uniref:hypothetical protein n=1 Tax=Aegicerativicinus sediminis TaxID=2893202 RepID=UPI001E4CC9B0|nr:hypothetical protein [Aegicerativicinus sediminis]
MGQDEREAYSHLRQGYLNEIGWWNAWRSKSPLGPEDNPIPWVTYSFIDFVEERLTDDLGMFEFGSGNSTLYYSRYIKEIHTVEHDKEWFEKIRKGMPSNVFPIFRELEYGGKYSKTAVDTGRKFDMIIVDGRDRVNCMINSFPALTEKGVMVLDDSEREQYAKGVNHAMDNGFRRIDFWGISPGLFYKKCTSIFYRDKNILGI